MNNVWFTADTHAWHQNIIGYCNRPWSTARDMTHDMADNINAHVPANGTLYHLGDFSWGNEMWIEGFRSMINCRKITLVLGNHDKLIRQLPGLQKLFDNVCEIHELNLGRRHRIVLHHYAMRTWNASFHGSWHLYGHSHGSLEEDPNSLSFDIGVDCWDFKPVSLDQVQEKWKEKQMLPDTIDSLVRRGMPTVFYITGGGSAAIPQLLQYGGGSAFLLEAQVPYDNKCVNELLGGHAPDRYCDSPTSRMLAVAAYQRAANIVDSDDVIGVGATSKLAKDNEREGRGHAVHVTIHGKNRTRTTTIPLSPHTRSRPAEERVAADIIVKEYCNFLDIPCLPPKIFNCEKSTKVTSDVTAPWDEQPRLFWGNLGHSYFSTSMHPIISIDEDQPQWYNPLTMDNPVIFPGSFNPCHGGHIKVAEHAHRITGKSVWFEISLTNCDKSAVDWVSLQERIDSLRVYKDNPAMAGIMFTNSSLFVQKARWFHQPTFIVGRDTAARIDNSHLYSSTAECVDSINELVRRKVQILVFDRKGSLKHPFKHLGIEKICTIVDEYEDAGENSTDIRRDNG